MVVILGYNNSDKESINEILIRTNIEFRYSLLESHILAADKIILPNPENFQSAYRKLNMMNLFSQLRMIKKPMLGINNGFKFMCNQITDTCKNGLGFFDIDVKSENLELNDSSLQTGIVNVLTRGELLDDKYDKSEILFNPQIYPAVCTNTCVEIMDNENKYSLLLKSLNKYAVYLNLEKNQNLASEVIKNFLLI